MTPLELQTLIHEQNKAVGWWDKPRSFSVMNNLFMSELGEAVEADRKSLPDDHLPQYPGVVVEACDCAIRLYDYLGSLNNTEFSGTNMHSVYCDSVSFIIADINWHISKAWQLTCINQKDVNDNITMNYLRCALYLCHRLVALQGYDPVKIILEKVEYNKHRADHKRENRQGEVGQKRY